MKSKWSSGDVPIWKHECFTDAFGDSLGKCTSDSGRSRGLSVEQCKVAPRRALDLLKRCLERVLGDPERLELLKGYSSTERELLREVTRSLAKASTLCVPDMIGSGDHIQLFELLKTLSVHLHSMIAGDRLVVPVSWLEKVNTSIVGHCLFIVLERQKDSFSLVLCNTGSHSIPFNGLRYHPCKVDGRDQGCGVRYKWGLEVEDIPLSQVLSSWFWFMMLRMGVWAVEEKDRFGSGCKMIYQVLVPYLNQKTFAETFDLNLKAEERHFKQLPLQGDKSLFWCAFEAVHLMMKRGTRRTEFSSHVEVLVMWEMCVMLKEDLETLHGEVLSLKELERIKTCTQVLANQASTLTEECGLFTCNDLKQLQDFIRNLIGTVSTFESKFSGEDNRVRAPKDLDKALFEPFLLFEQFSTKRSVEGLIGEEKKHQRVRPVQFNLVPEKVLNYSDIASALLHCDHICTILAYQAEQVSNSYALRVALIQHLFIRVIPVPLAKDHPNESQCLYRQPIRYETQVELLRILSLVARHFMAASMSLKVTKSFDASRILTMACMSTIADVVVRQRASDHPSMFCLHMNGEAPPSEEFEFKPFGFDMGPFAAQSQYMVFGSPDLTATRTKIIDYFAVQEKSIEEDHLIFDFQKSYRLGNLKTLLLQLCWEIGFPADNLGMYVSGENRQIVDNYPEFRYLRDIVFMFKYLMSPTTDALPEIKAWMPEDSILHWKFKGDQFTVKAFDRNLKCIIPELENERKSRGILGFIMNSFRSFRAGPSGGDPSALVGKQIAHEEDVLHVRSLPDFEGQLSQSDSELLISFLTTPYIRIPLLLNFFACEERVSALSVTKLQEVVEGVLFEPELFELNGESIDKPIDTWKIPFKDRSRLGTPCGLLFNELIHSPQAILTSITKLVDLALQQDTGRYTDGFAPMILFIVRIVVRIEGFVKFVLDHDQWRQQLRMQSSINSSGAKSIVRGLKVDLDTVKFLQSMRQTLRSLLNGSILNMLQEWLTFNLRHEENSKASIVTAHIAYLFFHIPADELDAHIVTQLLSCNIFLTTRFSFQVAVGSDEKVKRTSLVDQVVSLGIPETEIFDLFQKQRSAILDWLDAHEEEASAVMEQIIVNLTETKQKGLDLHSRIRRRSSTVSNAQFKKRYWRHMDGRHCIGRYIPDLKNRSSDEQKKIDDQRDLIRSETGTFETEINIQIGTLTLKSSVLEPLPESITLMEDFIAVFGPDLHQLQCAQVSLAQHRRWVRLVGKRHDLQLWSRDYREAPMGAFKRSIEGMKKSESWIHDIIEPYRDFEIFQNLRLYAPREFHHGEVAVLRGFVGEKKEDESVQVPRQMREVVVFKVKRTFHVFNIVEFGRRFYKVLVFSSNSEWCFSNLPDIRSKDGLSAFGLDLKSNPQYTAKPRKTLVIKRNIGTSANDEQMFLPSRFLYGLLPQTLVDSYDFWQNTDDSISGYHKDTSMHSNHLSIEFLSDNYLDTRISRRSSHLDECDPPLYLLNLLSTNDNSVLGVLAETLRQIEDLSHCLVWSRVQVEFSCQQCSVDHIELPRLDLSFSARLGSTGQWTLFSNDHVGLFLSDRESHSISKLLRGAPHSFLLESLEGQLALMIPSYPPRGHDERGNVYFDRRDTLWLNNLKLRHYFYDVHLSSTFVVSSSLSATLYLLIQKFLHKMYEDVFELATNCVSDTTLSSEELQLVSLFSLKEIVQLEAADAHACRLKLSLVNSEGGLALSYPWNVEEEMLSYIRKHKYVSSRCRFTEQEENILLSLCRDSLLPILNRRIYISAVLSGSSSAKAMRPSRPKLDQEFDSIVDESFKKPFADDFVKKLQRVSYVSPSEDKNGPDMIKQLNEWLHHGLKLRGGKDDLGFLFFYELLTRSIKLRILSSDDSADLGRLMVRLLPPSEYLEQGLLMSILRVLCRYDEYTRDESIPLVKEKSRGFFTVKTLFMGGDNLFSKLLKQLDPWLRSKSISFPLPYTPLESTLQDFSYMNTSLEYRSRVFIAPRITDFECSSILLKEMKPLRGVAISRQELMAFASEPLSVLHLEEYIISSRLHPLGFQFQMPFNLQGESIAQHPLARSTLHRLKEDVQKYSISERERLQVRLKYFGKSEVEEMMRNPSSPLWKDAKGLLRKMRKSLLKCVEADSLVLEKASKMVCDQANYLGTLGTSQDIFDKDDENLRKRLAFSLARFGKRECNIWFEFLVTCLLSKDSSLVLRSLNPFLDPKRVPKILQLVSICLLHALRIGQARRVLLALTRLSSLFDAAAKGTVSAREIVVQSEKTAELLKLKRFYMSSGTEGVTFDPRFLVFEYAQNIILRETQVHRVNQFVQSVDLMKPLCQQLIMGDGKTTVVAPLLSLFLGDSTKTVVQVVPRSLLEFSRNVLRRTFSSVVQKPVYTFEFDRFQTILPIVLKRFEAARKFKGIVVTHPTAVKAFILKFIELQTQIQENVLIEENEVKMVTVQLSIGRRVLQILRESVVMIDEIDVVLHPLKSELNFPMGPKEPLDFTEKIKGLGQGLRWDVPMHILDALLLITEGVTHSEDLMRRSGEAEKVILLLKQKVEKGLEDGKLQLNPHLIFLDQSFYHSQLKPLISKWMLLYIASKPHKGASDTQLLEYLEHGTGIHLDRLDDDFCRLINLSRDWVHNFLPHVFSKVNRVSYGLLSDVQLSQLEEWAPVSRKLSAVPFQAKDVPTKRSEFAHPDVLIGLTILSFRLEGMRESDFKRFLQSLKGPNGPMRFRKWVENAGGTVRGVQLDEEPLKVHKFCVRSNSSATPEIWPLRLIDWKDKEQFDFVFQSLRKGALTVKDYCSLFVFPKTLRYQETKLHASGQALGSTLLLRNRLGFSGTPSELIPRDMGLPQFQEGVDAKMLHVLTDSNTVNTCRVAEGWTSDSLVSLIASMSGFHALIDTGALITGFSNFQVARALLERGLSSMEGVLYLDEEDRKQVLLRKGWRVLSPDQAGLSPEQRFTFYDQVHATGTDVHQPLVSRALLTIGKDMGFRDLAQGAWRMRGIGEGQCLTLLVIPEVSKNAPDTPVGLARWLLMNELDAQRTQFAMLCEQDLAQVGRKKAFEVLLEGKDRLRESCLVFKEELDHSVEHAVPMKESLEERLRRIVKRFDGFTSREDKKVCEMIIAKSSGDSFMQNRVFEGEQEQEREQEQEQEQEMEFEQEKEKEVEAQSSLPLEEYIKKSYNTKRQDTPRWTLPDLNTSKAFYPLSKFNIYKSSSSIDFPLTFACTHDFFHTVWTLTAHRRLKNVIVLLELKTIPVSVPRNELSAAQRQRISDVWSLLNPLGSDSLPFELLGMLFESLDLTEGDIDASKLPFMDRILFTKMLQEGSFHPIDLRKRFIAVSLSEAESIRRILHVSGGHLGVEIALRVGNLVLDASKGFPSPSPFQLSSTLEAFKYFNSVTEHYDLKSQSLLVRVLQSNPVVVRKNFFLSLRQCRRRLQDPISTTSLCKALEFEDEFDAMELRALVTCVRCFLKARSLRVYDAFRVFDMNRDGVLSSSELFGGLEWLGLDVSGDLVRRVMGRFDNRVMRFEDFKAFFDGDEDSEWVKMTVSVLENVIESKKMTVGSFPRPRRIEGTMEAEEKVETMHPQVLDKLVVKVKPAEVFSHLWNCQQPPVSVWMPQLQETFMRRNRVSVCVGYIVKKGLGNPKRNRPPSGTRGFVLEVLDESTTSLFRSKYLSKGYLDHLMPPPVRYKKVFSTQGGVFWRGVPPSEAFVCLGMIFTSSEDQPPEETLRCVPRNWTRDVLQPPVRLWEDPKGNGSLWEFGALSLLIAARGVSPPEGPFCELAHRSIVIGKYYKQNDHKKVAQSNNGVLPEDEVVGQGLMFDDLVAPSGAVDGVFDPFKADTDFVFDPFGGVQESKEIDLFSDFNAPLVDLSPYQNQSQPNQDFGLFDPIDLRQGSTVIDSPIVQSNDPFAGLIKEDETPDFFGL